MSNNNNKGLNRNLLFTIIAAAIGSAFQHGYNTSVLNTPEDVFLNWIGQTSKDTVFIFGLMTSGLCIGGLFGGLTIGFFADKFGRKGSLLLNNIFVLLAVLFEIAAKPFSNYWLLFIGRCFIGFNSGLNAGIVPMYLSEITPVKLRGAVGSVYQLVVTISILVAMVLGQKNILGNESLWPYLLAFTSVPAIFQLCTLPFCKESPKYLLIIKKKDGKAQKALSWFRDGEDINDELREIKAEEEELKNTSTLTVKELLSNEALRSPLIIVLVVMIAQQFSGINAIFFFSKSIFSKAGLSTSNTEWANFFVAVINVSMTFVSMVLVDKFGRKTLLLIGFGGMIIVSFLLTFSIKYAVAYPIISWISVLLVVLFVIMFATGPGSIPWFLVSELFNQSARPKATSLGVAINWFANFIIAISFKPLQELIQAYVFLVFFVLLIIFTAFIYFKVPETKGKTTEEISALFRKNSYK